MQIDVSSPEIGACLRDLVLAKVKLSVEGLPRSQLTRDERAVATILAQDGLIRKEVVEPTTNSITYYPCTHSAA
jgi:hypothetical protein